MVTNTKSLLQIEDIKNIWETEQTYKKKIRKKNLKHRQTMYGHYETKQTDNVTQHITLRKVSITENISYLGKHIIAFPKACNCSFTKLVLTKTKPSINMCYLRLLIMYTRVCYYNAWITFPEIQHSIMNPSGSLKVTYDLRPFLKSTTFPQFIKTAIQMQSNIPQWQILNITKIWGAFMPNRV